MADNINVTPSGTTPIATDDVAGVQYQKVKVSLGDDGIDAGSVSNTNPIPAELVGIFKRLFNSLTKLTYDVSGQLRTTVVGSVSISGTAATNVTTMTTGNIGFGDSGKPSTVQQISANTFYGSIGRNFTRG